MKGIKGIFLSVLNLNSRSFKRHRFLESHGGGGEEFTC